MVSFYGFAFNFQGPSNEVLMDPVAGCNTTLPQLTALCFLNLLSFTRVIAAT